MGIPIPEKIVFILKQPKDGGSLKSEKEQAATIQETHDPLTWETMPWKNWKSRLRDMLNSLKPSDAYMRQ